MSSKNLELKAKCATGDALMQIHKLTITECSILQQTDTYFNVNNGRLKFRYIKHIPQTDISSTYELIYYVRADDRLAKESIYRIDQISSESEAQKLLKTLTLSLGVLAIVNKIRYVYFVQEYPDVRIHVDMVDAIGEYLEFEVLYIQGRSKNKAEKIMNCLIDHFKLSSDQLIRNSYSDLILNHQK